MKKLRAWFATPKGRQFFNIIYSLGASIVIVGALFKIIHVRGGDIIFIIGMSVEAAIFFLSAFDTSHVSSSPATGTGGYIVTDANGMIQAGSGEMSATTGSDAPKTTQSSSGGSGSSVIVVGGGGTASAGSGTSSIPSGASAPVSGGGTVVSGGGYSGPAVIGGGSAVSGTAGTTTTTGAPVSGEAIPAEDYAKSAAGAAQNLEDFSNTMKSLNETSQTILQAYKEIAETQNLGEAMNTVRYINDSLARIKNLYDGAIGDSYMFKEEMSKMTRHIEALNQVYARLLQAMTMNNPNNNNFPQNPPY